MTQMPKKYITCKEAKISPKFSDCQNRYPYELDYILVEWTGRFKKAYYSNSSVEILTVHNKKWCVVSEKLEDDEYTGYICKDWDTAKQLREVLI